MVTEALVSFEEALGVIPAIDLDELFAKYPWGINGLDSEQKQLFSAADYYVKKIKLGKEIIRNRREKGIIILNPSAVEAYTYFYKAFKISNLSEKYQPDEFIEKLSATITKLKLSENQAAPIDLKPDVNEIRQYFKCLSNLVGNYL